MIYQFALNINIFNLNIFVDNQTTIQTITNSKNYSNQYILRKICIKITKFQNKKIKIRLHWISIHQKISNNEKMNKLIKKIIDWRKKNRKINSMIVDNFSLFFVIKQRIQIMIHQSWNKIWKICKKNVDLKRYIDLSTKINMQFHIKLKKKQSIQ